jgi:glycerol kinase
VPIDALPEIVPTTGDFGAVTIGGRAVPLTASVVDQQAALYGHGCRAPGDAKITFGTGAFALAVAGPTPPPTDAADGLLPTVAWQKAGEPATYALDGGVHTAAAAVDWVRRLGLFAGTADLDGFGRATAIERGLVFVPALAGLACPHWDKQARGAWLGLELGMGRELLVQAVLEGVALRMAEVIDALRQRLVLSEPLPIDALGADLRVSDEPELTARGTAELAAEALGRTLELELGGRTIGPRKLPEGLRERFTAAIEAVRLYRRAG